MTDVAKLISQSALVAALVAASLPASAQSAAPGTDVCTVRSAQALIGAMIPATLPPIAQIQGLTGAAVVKVDLDASGVARNPEIIKSAGYPLLDRAALSAAVEQKFSPEVRDCESVAGTYAVEVEFVK